MTLPKAQLVGNNTCKIRLKDGTHKQVRMIPLAKRISNKIDNDGDHYTIKHQDYIVIDDNKVIGFLLDPIDDVMNDIYPKYTFQ